MNSLIEYSQQTVNLFTTEPFGPIYFSACTASGTSYAGQSAFTSIPELAKRCLFP